MIQSQLTDKVPHSSTFLRLDIAEQHPLTPDQQWERDLETLCRIEQQMEEAGEPPPCFFTAMGELMARGGRP